MPLRSFFLSCFYFLPLFFFFFMMIFFFLLSSLFFSRALFSFNLICISNNGMDIVFVSDRKFLFFFFLFYLHGNKETPDVGRIYSWFVNFLFYKKWTSLKISVINYFFCLFFWKINQWIFLVDLNWKIFFIFNFILENLRRKIVWMKSDTTTRARKILFHFFFLTYYCVCFILFISIPPGFYLF